MNLQPHKVQVVSKEQDSDFIRCPKFLSRIPNSYGQTWSAQSVEKRCNAFSWFQILKKTKFTVTGKRNPHRIHQNSLHSANVTIWCVVPFFGLTDPCWVQEGDGSCCTVKSSHCVHRIQTLSFQKSAGREIQHDEVTWYRPMVVIQ
jgi:hypothetical protein